MKLLCLAFSDRNGASARYRVHAYLRDLAADGIETVVRPPRPLRRGLRRLWERSAEEAALLAEAMEADVVWIQKRLFSRGFIARLAARRPYAFDFDDAIFTSPHGPRDWLSARRVRLRFEAAVRSAGLVLAGNEFLRRRAEAAGARTLLWPTGIDLSRCPVLPPRTGPGLVLGWIGSRSTLPYLEPLGEPLAALAREMPGLRVLIVADAPWSAPGVPTEFLPWSEDGEQAALAAMDVGLMPLPDNEWTRGKCALKALQYMAAGRPAVCSAAGAAVDMFRDGRDALLCRTAADWRAAILRLAGEPALARGLAASGRALVEERFSTRALAGSLVGGLTGLRSASPLHASRPRP